MPDNSRRTFLAAVGTAVGGVAAGTRLSAVDSATGATDSGAAWPMLYHDAANTGSNPGGVALTETPMVDWSRRIPGVEGAPAIADGVAYLGGTAVLADDTRRGIAVAVDVEDGGVRWRTRLDGDWHPNQAAPAVATETVSLVGERTVYGLSRADGSVQWSVGTDARITTAPAVADGTVYVGTESALHALDAATGSTRWRFGEGSNDTSKDMPHHRSYPRVGVDGDTVYLASGDLYALSAADGSVRWRADVSGDGWPTVADGSVVVTSSGAVAAVDAATGRVRWSADVEGPDVQLPNGSATVVDGTAIVPSLAQAGYVAGRVTAFSMADGSVEWTVELDGGVPGAVTAAGDVAYVGVMQDGGEYEPRDREVWAVDAANGSVRWRTTFRGFVDENVPAPTGDALYVADSEHYLYALAAEDESVTWRFGASAQAPVDSSPAVADGAVFVPSTDGVLHAVDVASGAERWRYAPSGPGQSSVTAADGRVFVGTGGRLAALDPASGTEQWGVTPDEGGAHVAETVLDQTVYATVGGDTLIEAFDATNGETRWTFASAGCPKIERVQVSPIVVDAGVYFAADDEVWALDRADGSPQWVTGSPNLHSMAVRDGGGDGTVYYGGDTGANSSDADVYALDAADGSERWSTRLDGVTDVPALAADGDTVYAMSREWVDERPDREHLHAIDADDGTQRWRFEIDARVTDYDDTVVVRPAADGSTVFAAGNRRVSAVDADTGTEVGQFDTSEAVATRPVATDDAVYAGSADGYLYRVERSALSG